MEVDSEDEFDTQMVNTTGRSWPSQRGSWPRKRGSWPRNQRGQRNSFFRGRGHSRSRGRGRQQNFSSRELDDYEWPNERPQQNFSSRELDDCEWQNERPQQNFSSRELDDYERPQQNFSNRELDDYERPHDFGTRLSEEENDGAFPRTYRTKHSITWVRSESLLGSSYENEGHNRLSESYVGDHDMGEDAALDHPFVQSRSPGSSRHCDSPFSGNFHQRDPERYTTNCDERRHPRTFEPKHGFHVSHKGSYRSTLEYDQEYDHDALGSWGHEAERRSPEMQRIHPRTFKPRRGFHVKHHHRSTIELDQEYDHDAVHSWGHEAKRRSPNMQIRHPRTFKPRRGFHVKHQNYRSSLDIDQEDNLDALHSCSQEAVTISSQNMQGCSSPGRVVMEPLTKSANKDGQLEEQIRHIGKPKGASNENGLPPPPPVETTHEVQTSKSVKGEGVDFATDCKRENNAVPPESSNHDRLPPKKAIDTTIELATKLVKDDGFAKNLRQKSSEHLQEIVCKRETIAEPHESSDHDRLLPTPPNISSTVEMATISLKNAVDFIKKLQQNSSKDIQETECKRENDAMPHESSKSESFRIGNMEAKCPSIKDSVPSYFKLMKDRKVICRTQCTNPPIQPSYHWNVDIVKRTSLKSLLDLPQFFLFPAFESPLQKLEWDKFFSFLYNYNKVAVVKFDGLKIHILPSEPASLTKQVEGLSFSHGVVAYEVEEACETSVDQKPAKSVVHGSEIRTLNSVPMKRSIHEKASKESQKPCVVPPDNGANDVRAVESCTNLKRSSSAEKGTCSSISKCYEAVKEEFSTERNFVRADPSYLKTLGQAHSGWIFGAIAELVDNARDARASRLEIAIETIYDKTAGYEIPMLRIIDDGTGMNHQEILRMVSFGHKQPDEDDADRIGRFGVGFKTGSMRLGKDALVLTQTSESRSIAFLSQTLNEGKDNLEIPTITYRRHTQCMEFDTSLQSEALAKYNLNAIKECSPFDEYLIGEKAGLFQSNTGTQIYIWNLDRWGSDYSLEWLAGIPGGSLFYQGDIVIRSRRVRTRPGQTSRKVFLDYSLQSYLQVIFSEPRMKIYVQGSPVRSYPLAKKLNMTAFFNDEIMGKPVLLTLGRSQVEWDEGNCGIFLYWHGRLIEAYKRVGGMIHSADMGRGVIGVIDVTQLMDDGNGGVWVHSNKQGFQDCEPYAKLEEWLGDKADEYWDKFFDAVQMKKRNVTYKPDNEWVQCDKCRKWRMLHGDYDSIKLPRNWFCYMEPFNGRCEMPEQKPGRGIITVGIKRLAYDSSVAAGCREGGWLDDDIPAPEGKNEDDLNHAEEDNVDRPVLKRLRRGPTRSAKK